jgi:hypothetical protein
MAATKKATSNVFLTAIQTLIAGLTNNLPSSLRSMNVGGNSMTIAQVLAQLQTALQMLTNVTTTKQAWQAAVAAKKVGLPTARSFYENVIANLKQAIGITNTASLAPFGIAPPKARSKPSSDTRAIAHAKSLATRAARGTMGSKQKAAITTTPKPTVQVVAPNGGPVGSGGNSSGSTPAPAVAPAPAPAAAPAPSAPATPAVPGTPAP